MSAERNNEEHPPLERLIAYHEGKLDAAAAEELRDHLALCPRCADQQLDLADFNAPPAPVVDLAARREASLLARAVVSEERARRFKAVAAIAAGLVLTTLGVLALRELGPRSGRGTQLALDGPGAANLPLASLWPASEVRSRGSATAVTVPAEAPVLGLILNLPDLSRCATYRAVLRSAEGRTLAEVSGLRRTEDGRFQFWVGAAGLSPGHLEVELYGEGEGCGAKLETFPLTLLRPAADGR